jgi:ABC-type dipeptide/oligopeptide/nickel transport system permease subunit
MPDVGLKVPTPLQQTQTEVDQKTEGDKPYPGYSAFEECAMRTARIFLAWSMVLLFVAALVVFGVHILGPKSWYWLGAEELGRAKDLALSIIVGLGVSGISSYFFIKRG